MEYVGEKYKLVIEQDDFAENPREEDNAGEMICFSERLSLGNKHRFDCEYEFLCSLSHYFVSSIEFDEDTGTPFESYEWDTTLTEDEMLEIISNNIPILPLYLYNHSGITISTSPFPCKWDSGQVGYIYMAENNFKTEFNNDMEKALKCLEAEVKAYDMYLQGEIYGFFLYKKEEISYTKFYKDGHGDFNGKFDDVEEVEWVEEDSCWGFYGDNLKENGIMDYFNEEVILDLGLI